MNRKFIRELQEGERIVENYVVGSKEVLTTTTGNPYISITLRDRTGSVDGKIWDNVDKYSPLFARDDFVRVDALVESFRGKLQLNVKRIRRLEEGEFDMAEFLPQSRRNADEMLTEINNWIESVKEPHLNSLLHSFFGDEAFLGAFKSSSGAKYIHHAFVSGLMEHTLAVVKICQFLAENYAGVNRDLLIAGALLHDIGKTEELERSPGFQYTDRGGLLGHIILGLRMVQDRIRDLPDFPAETAMLLDHMMISHQGELEFGSPKKPQTLEAWLLFLADNLDSRIEQFQAHVERDETPDSDWTAYHRLLQRYIYKGGRRQPSQEFPPEESSDNE